MTGPEWRRWRSRASRSPEQRGGRLTAEPIPWMGTVVVVEPQEAVERALKRHAAREVPAAKGDAPVLLQDRALQAFDETIGPRVPWLGPRVADAQRPTGVIEGALELRPAVGQHALEHPPGAPVVR